MVGMDRLYAFEWDEFPDQSRITTVVAESRQKSIRCKRAPATAVHAWFGGVVNNHTSSQDATFKDGLAIFESAARFHGAQDRDTEDL